MRCEVLIRVAMMRAGADSDPPGRIVVSSPDCLLTTAWEEETQRGRKHEAEKKEKKKKT